MKKSFFKIAQIIFPTFTLVVGIFFGMHYQTFQNEIMYLIYGEDAIENELIKNSDFIDKIESSNIDEETNIDSNERYVLPAKSEIDLSVFWDVWDTLRSKFFVEEKIEAKDVLYGAIAGMVDSLNDEHTVFFNQDEADDFEISVNGEVEGIGAEITYKKKMLVVVSVVKNSPAFVAGLKSDDIILRIDDVNTSEIDFFEAIKMIRGEKGTKIKINVFREDEDETLDFDITRDKIDVPNVEWEKIDDKYVHLLINRFTSDVEQELKQISTEAIAFDPDGIVLDLRDNGGGYMDQAVEVADEFIDSGVIVSRKYKNGKEDLFNADNTTLFSGYPLVVLINSESASASEIVAGAIQDHKVGTLIGEQSYGKGSVQQTLDFDGAILKLTVAKWYTPKKKNIDKKGIKPDIEIEITKEDYENEIDPQLDRAIEFLKTGK